MKKILVTLALVFLATSFSANAEFVTGGAGGSGGGSGTVGSGTTGQPAVYTGVTTTGNPTINSQPNPLSFLDLYNGTAYSYLQQNNYAYNLDPIYLTNLGKCVSKVKANAGNCRILMIGDSVTAGLYSNGTNSGNDSAAGPAADLAAAFNAAGINSSYNAWWGTGWTTNPIQGIDSRLTVGSSFTSASVTFQVGGTYFTSSTNTNAITFKPTTPIDTCRIWYAQSGTSGTISYNINGGSASTQATTNAGFGTNFVTITGTKGINTCNVSWSSGGSVFIVGMEAWDSTKSTIIFEPAGAGGTTTTNWTSSTTNGFGVAAGQLTTIAPDAVWVNLDINEWVNSIGVSTHTTNMQTIITAIKTAGADPIIVTGVPSSVTGSSISQATQQSYIYADYALAQSNNIALIDVFDFFNTYTLNSALYQSGNFYHPNQIGYQKYSNLVAYDLLLGSGAAGGINPIPFTTNTNGEDVDVFSNVSTGTGTSGFNYWVYGPGSSGTTQNNPTKEARLDATGLSVIAPVKTGGYTVATLPAGVVGMRAYVTDQTTACPAAGAALTGSGAVTCPVFFNGSSWVGD